LTNPTYLGGVDHINPHPNYLYTKPILLLIDHMDFSCGDFFAAIMQDNKRATLFGSKTAGAGGCVTSTSFLNQHGLVKFFYTFSLAERADAQIIENLGVAPDIKYELTEADLKTRYQPYAAAVNQAIEKLLNSTN